MKAMFQEKKVANRLDKSSLRAHDKMARTKTNTYNSKKHTEQQDVTDIQNKLFV